MEESKAYSMWKGRTQGTLCNCRTVVLIVKFDAEHTTCIIHKRKRKELWVRSSRRVSIPSFRPSGDVAPKIVRCSFTYHILFKKKRKTIAEIGNWCGIKWFLVQKNSSKCVYKKSLEVVSVVANNLKLCMLNVFFNEYKYWYVYFWCTSKSINPRKHW